MKAKRRRDAGRPRGEPIVDAVLMHTLNELAITGLGELSVERIARLAQVNKTSVYRRWPTRQALVAAALERVLTDVSNAIADTGSLRGDLASLLAPVVELLGSPPGVAVLRAAVSESSAAGVRELAERQLRHASTPMRAVVSRAKARGEWRAGASGEQLVFMLIGAVMHRVLLEHAALDRRWVAQLVRLAVDGVRPPPPQPRVPGAPSKR